MSSDSSLNKITLEKILAQFGFSSMEEFDRDDRARLAKTGFSSWTECNTARDKELLVETGFSAWSDVNKTTDDKMLAETGCSSWSEYNMSQKR
jgi:hypothetical protein